MWKNPSRGVSELWKTLKTVVRADAPAKVIPMRLWIASSQRKARVSEAAAARVFGRAFQGATVGDAPAPSVGRFEA